MGHLFTGSSNLISLDFSNYYTLSVKSAEYIFSGFNNLISLDLSNFDTYKVVITDNMLEDWKNQYLWI